MLKAVRFFLLLALLSSPCHAAWKNPASILLQTVGLLTLSSTTAFFCLSTETQASIRIHLAGLMLRNVSKEALWLIISKRLVSEVSKYPFFAFMANNIVRQ